jgi:uncharacterized membrane protein YvbJ
MSKLGIIRLELSVEEMRHHVVHALVDHHDAVQKLVDDEVKQFIESGAMEHQIKESVNKHLRKAVDDGVNSSISRWARESPTVKQAVEKAVHEALWQTEEG